MRNDVRDSNGRNVIRGLGRWYILVTEEIFGTARFSWVPVMDPGNRNAAFPFTSIPEAMRFWEGVDERPVAYPCHVDGQ